MSNESPRMSVVMVASDGLSSAARTLQHLRAQTVSRALEVLIVLPRDVHFPISSAITDFAALHLVRVQSITRRGFAAAEGVRRSSAPIIALVEDHAFPAPEWAEQLLKAHEGPYAGVGPAVSNANPATASSCVNFLLHYGAFCGAPRSEPRPLIPWHNSAYKRALLQPMLHELGHLLTWEGWLQERLRENGHTLYLQSTARIAHTNVSRVGTTILQNFGQGRLISATRLAAQQPAALKRLALCVSSLASPLLEFLPAYRQCNDAGVPVYLRWKVAVMLALALMVMATGRMVGYMLGAGGALGDFENYDLHRMRYLCKTDTVEHQRQLREALEPEIPKTEAVA